LAGATANDDYQDSDIEIELAGFLASAAARDPEDVRIIDDVMSLEVDDESVELLQNGHIEVALERIGRREFAPKRPRTPLETMIDKACGVPWAR